MQLDVSSGQHALLRHCFAVAVVGEIHPVIELIDDGDAEAIVAARFSVVARRHEIVESRRSVELGGSVPVPAVLGVPVRRYEVVIDGEPLHMIAAEMVDQVQVTLQGGVSRTGSGVKAEVHAAARAGPIPSLDKEESAARHEVVWDRPHRMDLGTETSEEPAGEPARLSATVHQTVRAPDDDCDAVRIVDERMI